MELGHLEDRQVVVFRGVGLRARDDVRARGEALALVALVVAEDVEREARPARAHGVPHDVRRLVGLEDLILAEGVQAGDERVRRSRCFVRFLDWGYDLVIDVHHCMTVSWRLVSSSALP